LAAEGMTWCNWGADAACALMEFSIRDDLHGAKYAPHVL
jgi:hypothetical protein